MSLRLLNLPLALALLPVRAVTRKAERVVEREVYRRRLLEETARLVERNRRELGRDA